MGLQGAHPPTPGAREAARPQLTRACVAVQTRKECMLSANPAFVPRNHTLHSAITAATDGDWRPVHRLLRVLSTPYHDQVRARGAGGARWCGRADAGGCGLTRGGCALQLLPPFPRAPASSR